MTTKLDKPIRREINIDDRAYTLTIDPDGLKLVELAPDVTIEEVRAQTGAPVLDAVPAV